MTHGDYVDYGKTGQCPSCLEEAERVMCPNNPDRECFYPDRCQATVCYFVNRERERVREQQEWEQQQREQQERQEHNRRRLEQERQQQQQEWADFREWFDERKNS